MKQSLNCVICLAIYIFLTESFVFLGFYAIFGVIFLFHVKLDAFVWFVLVFLRYFFVFLWDIFTCFECYFTFLE